MLKMAILSIIFICIIITILLFDIPDFSKKEIIFKTEENKFFTRKYKKHIELNSSSSLNFYFNIPEKVVYWSLGFFNENKCLKSINMSQYLNYEIGDILHVVLTKNANLISPSLKYIEAEHQKAHNYKRLLTRICNINCNKINIKYEIYYTEKRQYDLKIYQFKLSNVEFREFNEVDKTVVSYQIKENSELYNKKMSVDGNVKIYQTNEMKFCECLSFISEPFLPSEKFEIFAVNHFKTKSALHSHIIVLDYKTGKIIKFFHTGIMTNSIFEKNKLEIRNISFLHESKIVVIENIFLYRNANEISEDDIIKMKILN